MSRPGMDRKMRKDVATLTSEATAKRIAEVLRQNYGDLRCATKRLGRLIGADPRAVKNWISGTNAPRLAEAVRLMAECEDLRVAINEMVEEVRCQSGGQSSSSLAGSVSGASPKCQEPAGSVRFGSCG
jgi:hypothetical protein